MDNSNQIHSFVRHGAWVGAHLTFYRFAHEALSEYSASVDLLEARSTEIEESNRSENAESISLIVTHETHEFEERTIRKSVTVVLFACMAVEAFLNCYGVRRLGEKFYKRNMERIGITEKMSVLVLSCNGYKLDANASVLALTRRLFDQRNRLVHPKTKELQFDQFGMPSHAPPEELSAPDCVKAMDDILEEFCSYDSDLDFNAEFGGCLAEKDSGT